jgi:outer membrane protein W
MKTISFKSAIIIVAICLVQTVYAQEKTAEPTLKSIFTELNSIVSAQENPAIPTKKAFSAELNFTPFGDKIISFEQLQFKYRVSDKVALRLGLAFDHNKKEQNADDYLPSEQRKVTGEETLTKFGILPGIEYHFLKNSKISPYLGIEFSYFNRSVNAHYRDYQYDYTSGKEQLIPVEIDINGATRNISTIYIPYYTSPLSSSYYPGGYYSTSIEYAERAYTSFGGNLLAGCDFYFMRNVYVGVEVGLGYNHIKNKKITIDYSNEVQPDIIPSYTTSEFKFYYNSALRLGFWF